MNRDLHDRPGHEVQVRDEIIGGRASTERGE
jgi:hypothetical protein